jgi:hypothetical protein
MVTPKAILNEMISITEQLIKIGLSQSQNFPLLKKTGKDIYEVGYKSGDLSVVLKNTSYEDIYSELNGAKNYNFKMIDGALIQMMYFFKDTIITYHRLAFFPSPFLEDFQNEPEIYEMDEIYADILAKNIIPFPIRFDFVPDKHHELEHPKSHLTLGQFKNCRIPVAFPLTPFVFISFILRNFYNTAYRKFTDILSLPVTVLNETITENEKKILHISLSL